MFRARGADVHVWGTRETAKDYEGQDDSDLTGLNYAQVNVGNHSAIDAYNTAFDKLDILVLCQGIVRYGRKEFEKPDWDDVMAVNIDSVMGVATKSISLTKTLGAAWARDGIRVNGIAPGLVHTKLTAVTVEHDARREAALKAIPMRRIGTPDDMAGVALFLASPLAGYVLGQTLIVDGGLTLS